MSTCARLQGSHGGHQWIPAVPFSHKRLNGTTASTLPASSPAIGRFLSNPRQGLLPPPVSCGPLRRWCESHCGVYHSDHRQRLI